MLGVGVPAPLRVDIGSKSFTAADGTDVPVLKDVRFTVRAGGFTCLTGPSGCGKTTILRIVLGLDTDFDGEITIDNPNQDAPRIAAVFQEPCLLPWRTVDQNVRLALPKTDRDQNLDSLFSRMGLSEARNRFPSELSLGMARRVSLARAFAVAPTLLILDEPFVSLDKETADRLRALLKDLLRRHPATVLMVTHDLNEAEELSGTIIHLPSLNRS